MPFKQAVNHAIRFRRNFHFDLEFRRGSRLKIAVRVTAVVLPVKAWQPAAISSSTAPKLMGSVSNASPISMPINRASRS